MSESPTPRIVVLVSGGGTNLQALIDATASGTLGGRIVAVLSNRPDAGGLERARLAGIPAEVVNHRHFDSREAFDQQLMHSIDEQRPDLVVLAGFMRILTPGFVQHYQGRLLNIHPSLLPRYPGLHTHRRALEAGDQEHGATVHFVTEDLDGGPAVVCARVPVHDDDTPEILAARVLEQEHHIYPLAVRWFCERRLFLDGSRAHLDGQPLTEPVDATIVPE